jgi:hypothetical protein
MVNGKIRRNRCGCIYSLISTDPIQPVRNIAMSTPITFITAGTGLQGGGGSGNVTLQFASPLPSNLYFPGIPTIDAITVPSASSTRIASVAYVNSTVAGLPVSLGTGYTAGMLLAINSTVNGFTLVPAPTVTGGVTSIVPGVGISISSTGTGGTGAVTINATGGTTGTVSSVSGVANQIAITGTTTNPIVGLAAPSPVPTAGAHNNPTSFTTDAFGRVTVVAVSASPFLTGNQTITLTGAVTGSGTTSITTVLAAAVVTSITSAASGTPSQTGLTLAPTTITSTGTIGVNWAQVAGLAQTQTFTAVNTFSANTQFTNVVNFSGAVSNIIVYNAGGTNAQGLINLGPASGTLWMSLRADGTGYLGTGTGATGTNALTWTSAGAFRTVGTATMPSLQACFDVGAMTPTTGQVLEWNGTRWNAATVTTGTGGVSITASTSGSPAASGLTIAPSPLTGTGTIGVNWAQVPGIAQTNNFTGQNQFSGNVFFTTHISASSGIWNWTGNTGAFYVSAGDLTATTVPFMVGPSTATSEWFGFRGDGSGWLGLASTTTATPPVVTPTNGLTWTTAGAFRTVGTATMPSLQACFDVGAMSPANGQVLTWNGTRWINMSTGTGTVTSIGSNASGTPAEIGLNFSASPITTTGTIGVNWSQVAGLAQANAFTGSNTFSNLTTFSGNTTFSAQAVHDGTGANLTIQTNIGAGGIAFGVGLFSPAGWWHILRGDGSGFLGQGAAAGTITSGLTWDTLPNFRIVGTATMPSLQNCFDVGAMTPATNDVLHWNGTRWINTPPAGITGGTVTSLTAALGITLTPNPIVGTGTVAINPAVVPQLGTGAAPINNLFTGNNIFDGGGTTAGSRAVSINAIGNSYGLLVQGGINTTVGAEINTAMFAGSVNSTAGADYGVYIASGSVVGEYALWATNRAHTGGLVVYGDVSGFIGSGTGHTATNALTWTAAGAFRTIGTATMPSLQACFDIGTMTPAANDYLMWNGTRWINHPGTTTAPTGTITSIAQGTGIIVSPSSPLTSGPGTIAINTAVVPQLATANAFTGPNQITTSGTTNPLHLYNLTGNGLVINSGSTNAHYPISVYNGAGTALMNLNALGQLTLGVPAAPTAAMFIYGYPDDTAVVISGGVSPTGAASNVVGLGIEGGNQTTAGQWAQQIWCTTNAGMSNGLGIQAGTNANDISFQITNAANTATYFEVRGDGTILPGMPPNSAYYVFADASPGTVLVGNASGWVYGHGAWLTLGPGDWDVSCSAYFGTGTNPSTAAGYYAQFGVGLSATANVSTPPPPGLSDSGTGILGGLGGETMITCPLGNYLVQISSPISRYNLTTTQAIWANVGTYNVSCTVATWIRARRTGPAGAGTNTG